MKIECNFGLSKNILIDDLPKLDHNETGIIKISLHAPDKHGTYKIFWRFVYTEQEVQYYISP